MSIRRTDAYQNDPDCQAFEEAQAKFWEVWTTERLGKSKAESERLRVECDQNISAAKELLGAALRARGLQLDEHFDDHNAWVVDLVPLEAHS